ncbi:MAG: hypothetical protein KVP17_003548 [Porospora cf. gigantea B]|uniref:uncharacterized protein n=1 Tax=Porospora cf. gigantea B TaxID=2853592 RepID=UPI003571DCF9|nr:MAG: hypothetical protein KVP17_003548 [Porospora cf. gigantea B]
MTAVPARISPFCPLDLLKIANLKGDLAVAVLGEEVVQKCLRQPCHGCGEPASCAWPALRFDFDTEEIDVADVTPVCGDCLPCLDMHKQAAALVNHTLGLGDISNETKRFLALNGNLLEPQVYYDSVSRALLLYRQVKPVEWSVASHH